MTKPGIAVLYGDGLNTDLEMQHAFDTALTYVFAQSGSDRVHVLDMLSNPNQINNYEIFVIPGGFKDGDELESGTIGAAQIRHAMRDAIEKFLQRDTLLLGVCNGFQVLAKAGLLPYGDFDRVATLTNNVSGKFQDRWVYLKANPDSPCVWTRGINTMYLPIRHGEGRWYASEDVMNKMKEENLIALRYAGGNPNGALLETAGVCDPTGRIFGMMPHPEAYIHRMQHPRWTREKLAEEGDGLAIFKNAVKYFE